MKDYYFVANCSCGRDSLAMVIKLILTGRKVDEVIFFDTGAEYPCVVQNWYKLVDMFSSYPIKFTKLQPKVGLRDLLLSGACWCSSVDNCCRWFTGIKCHSINTYLSQYSDKNVIEYIGFTVDEYERIKKRRLEYRTAIFPLFDWGMSALDCDSYIRQFGFDFIVDGLDLYSYFERVSCTCCGNQSLNTLYYKWKYFPSLWNELKVIQAVLILYPIKKYGSIFDIEKRFENGFVPYGCNL